MSHLTISKETLSHFQCPHCQKWWSIGDAHDREFWFCPWCGCKSSEKKYAYSQIIEKYFPGATEDDIYDELDRELEPLYKAMPFFIDYQRPL